MGDTESPPHSFGLAAVEGGQGGQGEGPRGDPSLSPLSPGPCSSLESELTTSLAGELPLTVRGPGVAPPILPQTTPPHWVLGTDLPGRHPEFPPLAGAAETQPDLPCLPCSSWPLRGRRFSVKPLAGCPATPSSPTPIPKGSGQGTTHRALSSLPCPLFASPRPTPPQPALVTFPLLHPPQACGCSGHPVPLRLAMYLPSSTFRQAQQVGELLVAAPYPRGSAARVREGQGCLIRIGT